MLGIGFSRKDFTMNSKKINNALVSVILVNWNGKKWLRKCLSTLSSQTYASTEIIVVDNASNDGSVEFIQKFFPKVIIIRNEKNLGFPTANNIGVKSSKGDYLLLINTDTWVEEDFITKLMNFYTKNSYDIVSPWEKKYTGSTETNKIPTIDLTGSPAYFYSSNRTDKLLFLSVGYFCSRKNYQKSGGLDGDYFAYYEDVDWFWRMSLMKMTYSYADGIFVYHAGAGAIGKGIKYKMFLWRNQNALQTLLKNYSTPVLVAIVPFYILQNLVEIIFFLLIFRPQIAYTYIEGWLFNIKNFKKTLAKRKWVQQHRKVGDFEIMKKMYLGPAKLRMLLNYAN